ncbi:MAG: hypothetical protein ABSC14_11350, partial [Desulfomonilia bacterium]
DEKASGGPDCFVQKFDTNGGLVWVRQFGTAADDYGKSITINGGSVYITGITYARAGDAIDWIHELCSHMKVPPLSFIGIRQEHFSGIVAKARHASSMKGNPIVLTDEELMAILEKAS